MCRVLYFVFFLRIRRPPRSTRTDTLFPTRRSSDLHGRSVDEGRDRRAAPERRWRQTGGARRGRPQGGGERGGRARAPRDLHHPHRQPVSRTRSEEHTSELQSLMRISYAGFCLKKKKKK